MKTITLFLTMTFCGACLADESTSQAEDPIKPLIGRRVQVEGIAWGAHAKGKGECVVTASGDTFYLTGDEYLKKHSNGTLVRIVGRLSLKKTPEAPPGTQGDPGKERCLSIEVEDHEPINRVLEAFPKEIAKWPPGFNSPEEAFQAYLKGAATGDYDLMLSALTKEGRAWHIGLALFSAAFLFSEDTAFMEKLAREHGLGLASDDEESEEEPDEKESTKESDEKKLIKATLQIRNPGKLMKTIEDRHEQLAKLLAESDSDTTVPKKPALKEVLATVTLGKPEIDGDTAVAPVKLASPAKELVDPAGVMEEIRFRRIKNRWYCDIDPR